MANFCYNKDENLFSNFKVLDQTQERTISNISELQHPLNREYSKCLKQ